MALLNSKLVVVSPSGSAQNCDIYSTTTEAGSNYMNTESGYVPLVSTSDSRASRGRVIKSDTTYAIATTGKPAYGKNSYTSPGTYTFTVPSGVTKLKVEVAGAGGGAGGYAECTSVGHWGDGGKGGRGAKVTETITTSATSSYQVIVGRGGANGADEYDTKYAFGESGENGGSSSFGTITARGGEGGEGGEAERDGAKDGLDGKSYGEGGYGAGMGRQDANGNWEYTVQDGWVIVEYGGNI